MADKSALSRDESKKDQPPNLDSSPVIFIIIGLAVVGLILFLFKDKLFKKKNILKKPDEIKIEQITEPVQEPVQPEPVQEPEATQINSKFAELN